jgi:hypothetical protein
LGRWEVLRQAGVANRLSCPSLVNSTYIPSSRSHILSGISSIVNSLSFTMGAGDAPYLYDPPSRRQIAYPYSDFDPKAVTRASWISASDSTISKPKQQGPLIDFNRHPDSYMVVAPQIQREPLPPNTKTKVIAARWVQFGFRLVQLLGAVGCLLCVIFVRNTETAQGWIMRIPVSAVES